MLKVALTGGIASGKTYVGRRLREAGIPVVDSDSIVHQALGAGGDLVERVVERFGPGVRDAHGGINRAALGAIVFADPAARKDLEAIVHPHVYKAIQAWFRALDAATPFAVADIPLLYETGRASDFDKVVVTSSKYETQLARMMARDGLTRADAQRRLAAQWPIAEKATRADYVITTDGTKAETNDQVKRLVDLLTQEGNRTTRSGEHKTRS
jgi:dephospho-CoA kinase